MAAVQQPLPAGWEAKYDPGQGRYFFIDHSTHKTTWEDPRLHLQAPAPQSWQQASPHQPRAGRSPRHSTENIALKDLSNTPKWQREIEDEFNIQVNTMGHADDDGEEHQAGLMEDQRHPTETSFSTVDQEKFLRLKRMFPTADDGAIRQALIKTSGYEAKAITYLETCGYHQQNMHSQMKENNIVNKMKKEFPTADEDIIRDVIQCVDQNEARVIQELKALGYKHNSLHQPTPRQPSPLRKESKNMPKASSRTHSPKAQSPAKEPEISAAAKKKLIEKLAAQFSDYSKSMVEIALNSCNYNEDRSRKLLENMSKQRENKRSSPSRHVTSMPTTTRTTTPFTMPDFTLPTTSLTSSISSGGKKTSTVTSTSSTRPTRRPAQQKHKKNKAKSSSVQAYKTVSNYVSENRSIPKGPDPELVTGPDKDHLINDYVMNYGPDPSNYHGPNPDNRQGYGMASGSDRTLSFGPDLSLRCGADHSLIQGTLYGVKVTPETFL